MEVTEAADIAPLSPDGLSLGKDSLIRTSNEFDSGIETMEVDETGGVTADKQKASEKRKRTSSRLGSIKACSADSKKLL